MHYTYIVYKYIYKDMFERIKINMLVTRTSVLLALSNVFSVW